MARNNYLVFDYIKQQFELLNTSRSVRLYTGAGGAEMFDEAVEYQGTGYHRQYIGRKVLRILRKAHKIYKSKYTGIYYKRIKDPNWVFK
jgi:hypothetical protein